MKLQRESNCAKYIAFTLKAAKYFMNSRYLIIAKDYKLYTICINNKFSQSYIFLEVQEKLISIQ